MFIDIIGINYCVTESRSWGEWIFKRTAETRSISKTHFCFNSIIQSILCIFTILLPSIYSPLLIHTNFKRWIAFLNQRDHQNWFIIYHNSVMMRNYMLWILYSLSSLNIMKNSKSIIHIVKSISSGISILKLIVSINNTLISLILPIIGYILRVKNRKRDMYYLVLITFNMRFGNTNSLLLVKIRNIWLFPFGMLEWEVLFMF